VRVCVGKIDGAEALGLEVYDGDADRCDSAWQEEKRRVSRIEAVSGTLFDTEPM
jgi:hypothetical protein